MFYGETILRTDAVVFRNNLVLHKFPSQTAGHRPIHYSALQPSKVGSRRLSKHSFGAAKACGALLLTTRPEEKLRSSNGYPAWTRTKNNASKGRCVTITPRGNLASA